MGLSDWDIKKCTIRELFGRMDQWEMVAGIQQRPYGDHSEGLIKDILSAIYDGHGIGNLILVDQEQNEEPRFENGRYFVQDGNHRRTHIERFLNNEDGYSLEDRLGNTLTWADMDDDQRNQFWDREIAVTYYWNCNEHESTQVFLGSNNGVPLNDHQIFNAYSGEVTNVIRMITGHGQGKFDVPELYGDDRLSDRLEPHPMFDEFNLWMGSGSRNKLEKLYDPAIKLLWIFFQRSFMGRHLHDKCNFSVKGKSAGAMRLVDDGFNSVGLWEEYTGVPGSDIEQREVAVDLLSRLYAFMDQANLIMRSAEGGRAAFKATTQWEGLFMFMLGLEQKFNTSIDKITKGEACREAFANTFIDIHNRLLAEGKMDEKQGRHSTVAARYKGLQGQKVGHEWEKKFDILWDEFENEANQGDGWVKTCGIRGTKSQRTRSFSKKVRREVLKAQGGKCLICNDKLTLDDAHAHHVVHFEDGGPTTADNCHMLHRKCHQESHRGDQ